MNEWEIYDAEISFIEKQLGMSQQSKTRPCLVIISKLNDEWLAYPITGTKRDKHYAIRDWKQAGLIKPSYLVYDMAKPVKGLMVKSLRGKLSDYDIQRIRSERLLKEMNHTDLYTGILDAFDEIADKENNIELKKAVEEQKRMSLTENSLPDLAEENIIDQEDAGISSLFIDAINECWSMIDNYNSIIVTLDSLDRHEFDETLQGLLADRNREVGALQGILELLSPVIDQIDIGRSEAQSEVAFDVVEESYSTLTETTKGKKVRNAMFSDKRGDVVTFGIITAQNPMSQALSDLENSQRNNSLKQEFSKVRKSSPIYDEIEILRKEGKSSEEISTIIRSSLKDRESRLFGQHMLQYIPIEGQFGNSEDSFFLINVSLDEMKQFATTYVQTSFWFGETSGNGDTVDISYYERSEDDPEYKKVTTSTIVYNASELDDYFSKVGNLKFHIFHDLFDAESDLTNLKKVTNFEALNKSIYGNLTGYGLLTERRLAYLPESLNEAEDVKGALERRVIISTKSSPERKFRNDAYIQLEKEDDFEKVVRTALRMAPDVIVFDGLDFLYENPDTREQFVKMKDLISDTGYKLVEESFSINEDEPY